MKTLNFPKNFLWGAATSAYQVEGGNYHCDWETQDRLSKAGRAADHYHRFVEDFTLARSLNQNAQRISLEWSRIEPENGKWNGEALDHYLEVLKELKKQGFVTFVTVHHFTNPLWIGEIGGWKNPKTIRYFLRFVEMVAAELGDWVNFWITINEPNLHAAFGYRHGIWPPFEKSLIKAYRVYRNMLAAHNQAYEVIHRHYPHSQVGYALNIGSSEPQSAGLLHRLAATAVAWGAADFPLGRTKYDFIGLNYYHRVLVRFSIKHLIEGKISERGNASDMGWEIYPAGLSKVLMALKKFHKPIYITENGIADSSDSMRAKFIRDHLAAAASAMAEGVDVRGYLYWSLLDNFEWPLTAEDSGFDKRFGLIEVDFKTQKRTIRPSAQYFANICQNNALELT